MRTDEQIKKDVVDQLYWDSRIDASNVTVTVDAGAVTLTGDVPTHRAREAATEDTWLVSGVLSVENELKLAYAETPTPPGDDEIQADVRSALRSNLDLSAYEITVSVKNGWVTLEGTLDTFWKKLEAESEALSARGAIGVTNKIAIVPGEDVSDELIAEDVMDAIDRNLHVNVDDVDVSVLNGRVTLTGAVPSASAKIGAYNAARYTAGVIDVTDNLIIREPALAA